MGDVSEGKMNIPPRTINTFNTSPRKKRNLKQAATGANQREGVPDYPQLASQKATLQKRGCRGEEALAAPPPRLRPLYVLREAAGRADEEPRGEFCKSR